jgi:hypothetical protein
MARAGASDARTQPAWRGSATRAGEDAAARRPAAASRVPRRGEWTPKKGLIVNSTDICSSKHRANATYTAQSGKRSKANPPLRATCKKPHRKRHAKHNRRHKGGK